jgi:hypothetical protein
VTDPGNPSAIEMALEYVLAVAPDDVQETVLWLNADDWSPMTGDCHVRF